MKVKIAYLTSPAPDRYVLNFQGVDTLGNESFMQLEISEAHLANIIVDGASFALRKNRVPAASQGIAEG